ncbi:2-dehydro-3-deoxyphosphogluconate aldolase/(4S)-4-hydroxy-2-oxoglutarate aldolase [Actinoplanes lutulentus]|uniref:2-dehydro-3-deoxyphosphogluconate aldolase/(4S)-4-hydroxy-2-oxoglutarate aldolase n=1 Tax=Actinoplanes lutulentus TaxID=1287878 RepID=A0A327ZB99_9ACTN|nr:bifunctional 4-hydroxy-2-oxoglutarate aldolase/2-dehydro-3-deoxy-phosphogluconate aldolase [Actinoplanes lutulentus]MBB2947306.1 2-dehydro-3-deoxyphosphogluconate aldolase/(4S)-4-hydroxy-2-oxoglutarate aldolase [Actinoplanes lutulentus]RAK36581.1 2-dehydro-3-deoxyphosphogluconate aldolase/(4S)-4-hydroxy-2-oxoglutarate aldolase [Actinoplanes lutulentus]
MTTLNEALQRCPAIAIIRARTSDRVPAVVETLAEAGLTAVELTLTTAGALEAITALAGSLPDGLALGAGTVLDEAGATNAVEAGASFLITPAVLPAVLDRAGALGVPVVCGALTPTEIIAAHAGGAHLVKVFPADAMGGPAYLRAVRGPLPDIPLVPTGGVAVGQAADYLRAGARAVALGGPLIGDAADDGGDLRALARRARELTDRLKEFVDA